MAIKGFSRIGSSTFGPDKTKTTLTGTYWPSKWLRFDAIKGREGI
jgi:hypothetical protein